jgi:hypothetical protein
MKLPNILSHAFLEAQRQRRATRVMAFSSLLIIAVLLSVEVWTSYVSRASVIHRYKVLRTQMDLSSAELKALENERAERSAFLEKALRISHLEDRFLKSGLLWMLMRERIPGVYVQELTVEEVEHATLKKQNALGSDQGLTPGPHLHLVVKYIAAPGVSVLPLLDRMRHSPIVNRVTTRHMKVYRIKGRPFQEIVADIGLNSPLAFDIKQIFDRFDNESATTAEKEKQPESPKKVEPAEKPEEAHTWEG